ncbi:phasin family protein [Puniceibacterium confluentis]|uniref:phasin family protein n=1 Tax=Puniceibacterium confluentis TaxID=1958944 RepID=UPI001FEB11C3|nr:phasin family protein [Puniceibacterium confluentis]
MSLALIRALDLHENRFPLLGIDADQGACGAMRFLARTGAQAKACRCTSGPTAVDRDQVGLACWSLFCGSSATKSEENEMKQKTESSKQPQDTFDPFVAFKSLSPAARMGTAWFEHVAVLGSEISSFVAERIKEDVKTQHALLNCKSLPEVQRVQAEFLQKAFDQYQAETGKLIEMSGAMAADDPEKDHTCV